MTFTGVAVNAAGIFLAGLTGSLLKKGMPERVTNTLMSALGLCVLFVGLTGFDASMDIIILVLSLALGALAGELLDIDGKLNSAGDALQKKIQKKGKDNIAEGFVSATLFVCTGAMAIAGGIESGSQGTWDTYLAKSSIDILVVFVMAATKGAGCALAAFPCFIYEALLTIFSGFISGFLTAQIISQMSVTGSVLIAGIGLNLLGITRIRIANFIFAPFLPAVFYLARKAVMQLV